MPLRRLFPLLFLFSALAPACANSSSTTEGTTDAGGGTGTGDDATTTTDDGGPSGGGDGALGDDASKGDAGPPGDMGPGGDFRTYADGAAAALQKLYDTNSGLFPSTGWWNSANALTALIDYSARTGSSTYLGDITNTFSKNSGSNSNSSGNFLNKFYDDEGWWALAWIDAYDLTKNTAYLDMAKTIFADMKGGWGTACNGGIWWSKDNNYKNAIANELFLEVAVRLHQRTPGDAGSGSFIDWATREWTWFDGSGMINASHLVNDGLTNPGCTNNNGTTWTYNQGVLIGGLVDLAQATNNPALLTRAEAIADASMQKIVDDQGVLREPCEPNCGGDGPQFKGIFMRHLAELAAATKEARYSAFIATSADWAWNAAQNGQGNIGLAWSQGFDSTDGARQASALDALNAAIPLTSPQPNVALFKTVTANGSCSQDQTADKAFDGTTLTKWCAGSSNGTYFLQVDLGAQVPVGRVIVRHAGAGGEKTVWNTKDFKVRVSNDASTWTDVKTVTGNTRSVTIHRVLPAASARYLRLDITAPQSDPSTIAARIYELEVYAR